jgi:hypothetical protein
LSTDTNFNVVPYGDDFDPEKDFYRILFKPGIAVQARELTQLQTILQQQVERFGSHILKDGTIVTGCSFTFDNEYSYVKLPDLLVNGQPVSVGALANTYVRNSANLTSIVVGGTDGLESQTPDLNTIYVKYLNSGTGGEKKYAANETLTVYGRYANGAINVANTVATVKVANSSFGNVAGQGYAFSVNDGILYQKGFFSRVEAQTVVVEKYGNEPDNLVVGFRTLESIVDSDEDTSLLDNASGATNENAPGADRLKLTPTLAVYTIGSTPNNFFAVVEFDSGRPVKQRQQAQYAGLAREFSQRTFEESGNYAVRQFNLSSTPISGNTTHLNVSVGAGLAYVEGYRVQTYDTSFIPISKATQVREKTNQVVSLNYGNYVLVDEVIGAMEFNEAATVSLRDTAGDKISGGSLSVTAPGVEIGTAKIRSFVYDSGVPGTSTGRYRAYIFDVRMNAGKNFKDVRSLYYNATNDGVADIVLEAGSAYLYETDFSRLLFPIGASALKTLRTLANANECSFTYRTLKDDGSFNTSGQLTITLPSGSLHPYTPSSTLNDTQELDVVVIPLASANGANATGTVSTFANTTVQGSSTDFLDEFSNGQWIWVNGQARQIDAIANSTIMTVTSAFGNSNVGSNIRRHFPANVPVKMSGTAGGSISINGSGQTMTIDLGTTINATTAAAIYYNVQRNEAAQVEKDVIKGVRVKIDLSSHAAGVAGPWSLGVPDAFNIQAIYKHSTFTSIETAGTDVTSHFTLETGQTENYYGLSSIRKRTGSSLSLTTADRLIVVFDVFREDTTGGGRGFFSVDSYPIDDATVPLPSDKIRTETIPVFGNYDLRNVLDFRPMVANTVAYTTTVNGGNTNPSSTEAFGATERYFPKPNDSFEASLQYYLPRMDRIALDAAGSLRVVQGVASENPSPPPTLVNAITLGIVTVPPYPSLPISTAMAAARTDYAVRFQLTQNRRYTMSDIGDLDARLSRVEYYTSLSLLEKATSDLMIPSEIDPTLNRFKNGIFVDPYQDFALTDLTSAEFSAAISKDIGLQTKFKQGRFALEVEALTNLTQTGDIVTADYTDTAVFSQPYATKTRNAAEQFYKYTGKLTLTPIFDGFFDSDVPPEVVVNDPGIDPDTGNETTPINTDPPRNPGGGNGNGGGLIDNIWFNSDGWWLRWMSEQAN